MRRFTVLSAIVGVLAAAPNVVAQEPVLSTVSRRIADFEGRCMAVVLNGTGTTDSKQNLHLLYTTFEREGPVMKSKDEIKFKSKKGEAAECSCTREVFTNSARVSNECDLNSPDGHGNLRVTTYEHGVGDSVVVLPKELRVGTFSFSNGSCNVITGVTGVQETSVDGSVCNRIALSITEAIERLFQAATKRSKSKKN